MCIKDCKRSLRVWHPRPRFSPPRTFEATPNTTEPMSALVPGFSNQCSSFELRPGKAEQLKEGDWRAYGKEQPQNVTYLHAKLRSHPHDAVHPINVRLSVPSPEKILSGRYSLTKCWAIIAGASCGVRTACSPTAPTRAT
jgi:hypothetical protein